MLACLDFLNKWRRKERFFAKHSVMRQKHKTSRNATTITRNAICLVLCKKVLLPNTAHTTHEMSVRTPEQFLTSTLLDSQYTIALTVQNIAWKSTMK